MRKLTVKKFTRDVLAMTVGGMLVLGIGSLEGCKPVASGTSFYAQAAKVMADYGSILASAQTLFDTAHSEALVNNAQYLAGQKVFLTLAQDGQTIDALIKSGAGATTIVAQVNALAATIASMPNAFSIKNPQSQAEFTALAGSLTSLLDTVDTLIQNPTQTAPAISGAQK